MASLSANLLEQKKSICVRKEFNSQRTDLGHQHSHCFIVLGHQYGRLDVMWKHSIPCLRQKGQNQYPGCTAAHPRIGHIREYLGLVQAFLFPLKENTCEEILNTVCFLQFTTFLCTGVILILTTKENQFLSIWGISLSIMHFTTPPLVSRSPVVRRGKFACQERRKLKTKTISPSVSWKSESIREKTLIVVAYECER